MVVFAPPGVVPAGNMNTFFDCSKIATQQKRIVRRPVVWALLQKRSRGGQVVTFLKICILNLIFEDSGLSGPRSPRLEKRETFFRRRTIRCLELLERFILFSLQQKAKDSKEAAIEKQQHIH
jgi:hypothetical protein